MRHRALPLIAAGAFLMVATPSHADVFSSQGFSGETTTLNNLPGVNLHAAPGSATGENCVESEVNSFSWRDGGGTRTDCKVGNFTFSTVRDRGSIANPALDTTYGGNPPPWEQRWRP